MILPSAKLTLFLCYKGLGSALALTSVNQRVIALS